MQNHNFIPHSIDTAPQTIKKFIDNVVNTFVRWDIIKFFYSNPNTCDTLLGIAKNIGRDIERIEQDIRHLTLLGYLQEKEENKNKVYRLTEDKEKLKQIEEFLEYCKTREGRFKVVYRILRGGAL